MENHKNDIFYILSIDQGTSSTRIAIIDNFLNIVDIEQVEQTQIHQHISWTEQDPIELDNCIKICIKNIYNRNSAVKLFLILK